MPSGLPLSFDRPLRIAIVGAGPAGFYTAAALLAQAAQSRGETAPDLQIDILDRLPTPYGLVRFGVAPDHPKIKEVVRVFERVALDPRVRFLGGVELGGDLSLADLAAHYDQVVVAVGGQSDRRLGLPGEDLAGSHSSTALVAWYSAHPDFLDLPVDLSVDAAAVVGAGNVAVDVARILGRNPEDLASTDISDEALARLRTSRIRDVHFIVRRGSGAGQVVAGGAEGARAPRGRRSGGRPARARARSGQRTGALGDPQAQKNMEILRARRRSAARRGAARRIHLRFLVSPVAIEGDGGRVTGLCRRAQPPDRRARRPGRVGYRRALDAAGRVSSCGRWVIARCRVAGLPFDDRRAIIPNQRGRVIDGRDREPVAGPLCRGLGQARPDRTHRQQQAGRRRDRRGDDRGSGRPRPCRGGPDRPLLAERGLQPVDFAGWKRLDQIEVERGRAAGRPRVKFGRVEEMRAALATEPVA